MLKFHVFSLLKSLLLCYFSQAKSESHFSLWSLEDPSPYNLLSSEQDPLFCLDPQDIEAIFTLSETLHYISQDSVAGTPSIAPSSGASHASYTTPDPTDIFAPHNSLDPATSILSAEEMRSLALFLEAQEHTQNSNSFENPNDFHSAPAYAISTHTEPTPQAPTFEHPSYASGQTIDVMPAPSQNQPKFSQNIPMQLSSQPSPLNRLISQTRNNSAASSIGPDKKPSLQTKKATPYTRPAPRPSVPTHPKSTKTTQTFSRVYPHTAQHRSQHLSHLYMKQNLKSTQQLHDEHLKKMPFILFAQDLTSQAKINIKQPNHQPKKPKPILPKYTPGHTYKLPHTERQKNILLCIKGIYHSILFESASNSEWAEELQYIKGHLTHCYPDLCFDAVTSWANITLPFKTSDALFQLIELTSLHIQAYTAFKDMPCISLSEKMNSIFKTYSENHSFKPLFQSLALCLWNCTDISQNSLLSVFNTTSYLTLLLSSPPATEVSDLYKKSLLAIQTSLFELFFNNSYVSMDQDIIVLLNIHGFDAAKKFSTLIQQEKKLPCPFLEDLAFHPTNAPNFQNMPLESYQHLARQIRKLLTLHGITFFESEKCTDTRHRSTSFTSNQTTNHLFLTFKKHADTLYQHIASAVSSLQTKSLHQLNYLPLGSDTERQISTSRILTHFTAKISKLGPVSKIVEFASFISLLARSLVHAQQFPLPPYLPKLIHTLFFQTHPENFIQYSQQILTTLRHIFLDSAHIKHKESFQILEHMHLDPIFSYYTKEPLKHHDLFSKFGTEKNLDQDFKAILQLDKPVHICTAPLDQELIFLDQNNKLYEFYTHLSLTNLPKSHPDLFRTIQKSTQLQYILKNLPHSQTHPLFEYLRTQCFTDLDSFPHHEVCVFLIDYIGFLQTNDFDKLAPETYRKMVSAATDPSYLLSMFCSLKREFSTLIHEKNILPHQSPLALCRPH